MKAPMNYYRKPQDNSQSKTIAIVAALAFHAVIIGAITMGSFKGHAPENEIVAAQVSSPAPSTEISDLKKRIEARKAAMQQKP